MKKTKAKKGGNSAVKVGAGLVAASAAVAAGYYFYGSAKAKQHRKIAVQWADDMKKEVMEKAKRLKEDSPEAVAAIVDRVAKTYQKARSIDAAEIRRAAKELKANWNMVKKETNATVRKSVSRAKKTAVGKHPR